MRRGRCLRREMVSWCPAARGGKCSAYVFDGEIANGPVPVCQILVLQPSCRNVIYLPRI
jgi:hypothetical protein